MTYDIIYYAVHEKKMENLIQLKWIQQTQQRYQ